MKDENSKKFDKEIFRAYLAELCDRHKDKLQILKNFADNKREDLSLEEKNLYFTAYKGVMLGHIDTMRKIQEKEEKYKKEKENFRFLPFLEEYKKKVLDKMIRLSGDTIYYIYVNLLPRTMDFESKAFYFKMIGDINKKISEYAEGDYKKTVIKKAVKAYKNAAYYADELSFVNPITLGIYLNYSALLYDEMNDHTKAIEVAKEIIKYVEKEIININKKEEKNVEIFAIYEILKENLAMWEKNKEKEEQ